MAQTVKNLPAMQETQVQFHGEGNGYLLQCSCLKNSMDIAAWRVTVHGVARVRLESDSLAPEPCPAQDPGQDGFGTLFSGRTGGVLP